MHTAIPAARHQTNPCRAILQAPFTPFIVIFCNAILHCDPFDLNSLSDFVDSLESCRTISEGADKLYRMCHLFLQVARLYVEAKTKEALATTTSSHANQENFYTQDTGINLSTMTKFDPYLSALGLMPNAAAWSMSEFPAMGTGASVSTGMETPAQDWFSGSRYLLNLMEDDIQMPDLNL